MKKILALLMALCLLCGSAMAAPTLQQTLDAIGYPVVDEPLDVTIAVIPQGASVDFKTDRNWMTLFMEQYSGLNITWQLIDPASAGERVPMMLNSGDLPDALLGRGMGTGDIVHYGVSEGMFYPVNELFEYMPNFSAVMEQYPAVRPAITTPDGNIYGFPCMADQVDFFDTRFFYQSTWLDRLGIEVPSTLAEFKDMLVAFRDQDADGDGDATNEIPWCGSWSESWSERTYILYAFNYLMKGSGIALSYNEEEPKVVFVPYEENYKDYLLYMKDLWDEGLMDPDMFTQTEQQVQTTVLDGHVGFAGMSAPYVYDPEHQTEWLAMPAVAQDADHKAIYPGPKAVATTSYMVINADADENVAIALAKFADAMYTIEWCFLASHGPEKDSELDFYGWNHYVEDNVIKYTLTDDATGDWMFRCTYLSLWSLPGFNADAQNSCKVAYGEKYPDSQLGKMFADGNLFATWVMDCKWHETYIDQYTPQLPDLFFSAEDQDRINELTVPLQDYVASCEAKFITGEMSIEDELDAFKTTLESYGVQELVDLYNKYYDAYKAN